MTPTPPASGEPARRVFCIGYSSACEPGETPRLHQTRDGNAALELMSVLLRQGYDYETALHFYPSLQRPADSFTFIAPADLLLLPTRPPIEHWLSGGRIPPAGRLKPSDNALENALFTALAPLFSVISRFNIEVSPTAASWLTDEGKDYAVLDFTRYAHAFITHRARSGDKHAFGKLVSARLRYSAGYFVKLHAIPHFKCGLLCCFAPGGVENLLFARLVRRKFPHWLEPAWQGFSLVRFKVPTAAEDTPLTVANFDDEISWEVLGEHPFDTPPDRS